jgi:uncharacterized protein (DUF1697 family)
VTTFIVLLRGVNVGGNNRVPMAGLRAAVEKAGFSQARTYVNSGNLVMEGTGTPVAIEKAVEGILAKAFKVDVPVIVRTAAQWKAYAKDPFPDADAKRVQLGLSKSMPASGCAKAILERADSGEEVKVVGDAVWIHFPAGVGGSKLTPAFLDKAAGSPLTLRNRNTVHELATLAGTGS